MPTVTLTGWTPIPHDEPWIIALLEEANSADGVFTQIDAFTLDPVDTDPGNPQARDFTSENATLDSGWYRIVWVDGASNRSTSAARQQLAAAGTGYWPTVDDVGQLIAARTYDGNGVKQGTFTDSTKPTRGQVYALVRAAAAWVRLTVGESPAAALVQPARDLIATKVAMVIESSYYADQVAAGDSQYPMLKGLYDEGLAALKAARLELGADEEPGTADDSGTSGLPVLARGGCVGPVGDAAGYGGYGGFRGGGFEPAPVVSVMEIAEAAVATEAVLRAQADSELVPLTAVGAAGGVAGLGDDGVVPPSQLPPVAVVSVAGRTGAVTLAEADVAGLVGDLAGKETPSGAQAKADAAQTAATAHADTVVSGEATARAAADALLVPLTQKGAVNGVASLGADGLVPAAQIGGSIPVPLPPDLDETFAVAGPRTVSYSSATEVPVPVMVAPFPLIVTGLKVITPTAQAASDTNYWLVMLRRRRMSLAVYELANLLGAQSPYGWWKLNETSGTTAADSGSGAHTLTMSTTAPTLNQASLARRASDPSMTFVAASSTNLHDTTNTNWGYAQQLTIVAMIKPTFLAVGNSARSTIFARVASGHPHIEVGGKAGNGRLAYFQSGNSFQSETGDYTILPGNTYMVALRKNGSGATKDFFINGVKQRYNVTTYLDSDLATTGAATYIGSREAAGSPTSQFFDGGIDEVAVFKSALSDATLQQFADVASPMAEISRKTTKTAASGGEGITAWQPWTFDGVPLDPYASVCDKDDVVAVSFYPVGTPGSLSDVILEVTYEAL